MLIDFGIIMNEPPLTIQDAVYLLEILDKDIPSYEKNRIALLLLILTANPDMAKNNKEVVGYSSRTYSGWYSDYDDCGYC